MEWPELLHPSHQLPKYGNAYIYHYLSGSIRPKLGAWFYPRSKSKLTGRRL